MAILITGANGHVGQLVVRKAAALGLDVIAQVRSLDKVPNRKDAEFGERVTWIASELTDPFSLAAALSPYEVEGCIHLAAVPNDKLARRNPWVAVQTNVVSTGALLELARQQKWHRFVYVSTGSVFQNNSDMTQPIPEDHPTSPQTTYGATKRAGELLVQLYRNDFDVSAASVRISHVYGPPLVPTERDYPRGPVVAMLREAVLGQTIRDATGGDYQSSFTHVEDVADGLLAAYRAERLNHDVYHLGHGRNWTTSDVVEAIRNVLPDAEIEVGPGTKPWSDYTAIRGPLAGDRLRNDTGFTPKFPLPEGVADFLGWMQANRAKL